MKHHILWTHGLNCSSKIFTHLHSQMPSHKASFIEYESQGSIEESLLTVIKSIPAKGTFSIVGHSLGGILGHIIATRYADRIDKLVTISSPFGGSEQAGVLRWLYPNVRVLKDIAPNSAILREIIFNKPTCQFLSIVSTAGSLPFIKGKNDGIVSIQSQMSIKPTHRIEVNSNHFEAVQDIDTINAVKEFIFTK